MERRRFVFATLFGLSVVTAACDKKPEKEVTDTLLRGEPRKEQRKVQSFDAIIADGRVDVRVTPGDSLEATLSGPGNFLEHITLKTEARKLGDKERKVLVVSLPRGVKPPLPIVEVQTPSLRYVEALGPAKVKVGDFSGESLSIKSRYATKIELAKSTYGLLAIEAEEVARVLGPEVTAEEAHVSTSGSTFVKIGRVARLLKKSAGGKIAYKGNPELLAP